VGDPHLLRTLLANLLGNAWKYSATRQQPRISFGIVHAAPGGPAFCVADNGVGFDMEHAPRLFHPFERLHTRGEFDGVGLGLVMARRVVERHGGRIWVEAAPDQGARVFFRLAGVQERE
jgi:signal transduction histidine kinase